MKSRLTDLPVKALKQSALIQSNMVKEKVTMTIPKETPHLVQQVRTVLTSFEEKKEISKDWIQSNKLQNQINTKVTQLLVQTDQMNNVQNGINHHIQSDEQQQKSQNAQEQLIVHDKHTSIQDQEKIQSKPNIQENVQANSPTHSKNNIDGQSPLDKPFTVNVQTDQVEKILKTPTEEKKLTQTLECIKKLNQIAPYKILFDRISQLSQLSLEDNLCEQGLKDNPIAQGYWERRKDSLNIFHQWINGCFYFLQDHLNLMDYLLIQLDSRIKVTKNSHHLMIKYFKDRIIQLESYSTQFNLQEPQSILGTLYSNDTPSFTLYPKLTMQLFRLEHEDQSQHKAIVDLKTWLDGVIRLNLEKVYKQNTKVMSELRKEIKFQRSIVDEQLQTVLKNFISYTVAYQDIQKFSKKQQQQQDLYVFEFKLRYWIHQLISAQREYGKQVDQLYKIFTQSELQLLQTIQEIYLEYLPQNEKLFVKQSDVNLLQGLKDVDVKLECQKAYDISLLFGEENNTILKKYCGDMPVDKTLLKGFSCMFKIDKEIENHPLILKTITLSRDVAWERSLSMNYEFIQSVCKITVDGYLLFFDPENQDNLDKPNTTLHLYNLSLRESEASATNKNIMVLTQKSKGFLFNSSTKLRVIFDDQLDGEALQLLINNYKM